MTRTNQATITPLPAVVDRLRTDIDRIDDQILDLLEQRYAVVQRIARAKRLKETQALALRPGREQRIVSRLIGRAGRVPAGDIRHIWRAILSLSSRQQRHYRILLWGPEAVRPALSTLAAARYGEGVPIAWADDEASALAEAARGDAILIVADDGEDWIERTGLDLIERHATGWPAHAWALELGRLDERRDIPSAIAPAGGDWPATAATGKVVAYLGGRGSYSEQACRQALPGHQLRPLPDFASVIAAVREGSADQAVVPVENSIAGPIHAVLRLLGHPELRQVGETELAVQLHLLGVPGSSRETVVKVSSHPAALIQCRDYLDGRTWARMPMASTAEAAGAVAAAGDPGWAAIGSEAAAALHDLVILDRDLQGEGENITRFVILERRDTFA